MVPVYKGVLPLKYDGSGSSVSQSLYGLWNTLTLDADTCQYVSKIHDWVRNVSSQDRSEGSTHRRPAGVGSTGDDVKVTVVVVVIVDPSARVDTTVVVMVLPQSA